MVVGVPGKDIGALRPKGGGATGESSAGALLDSPCDCTAGPVSSERAEPCEGLSGGRNGCDGESIGVAKPRIGSTILLNGESVFKGGRSGLGAGGNDDVVLDTLNRPGSKLGARGLRVGALCEVEKGGGGAGD